MNTSVGQGGKAATSASNALAERWGQDMLKACLAGDAKKCVDLMYMAEKPSLSTEPLLDRAWPVDQAVQEMLNDMFQTRPHKFANCEAACEAMTAVKAAIVAGHVDVLRELLKHGADPIRSPCRLHNACTSLQYVTHPDHAHHLPVKARCEMAVLLLEGISDKEAKQASCTALAHGPTSCKQIITFSMVTDAVASLAQMKLDETDWGQLAKSVFIRRLPFEFLLGFADAVGRNQESCLHLSRALLAVVQSKVEVAKLSDTTRHLQLAMLLAAHPSIADAKLTEECFKRLWDCYCTSKKEDADLIRERQELEHAMRLVGKCMPDVMIKILSDVAMVPIGDVSLPAFAPDIMVETSQDEAPKKLYGFSTLDFLLPWSRAPLSQFWSNGGVVWKPVLYGMLFYGTLGFINHLMLMLGVFLLWVPTMFFFSAVRAMWGARHARRFTNHYSASHKSKDHSLTSELNSVIVKPFTVNNNTGPEGSTERDWVRQTYTRRSASRAPVPFWASFHPKAVLGPLLAADTDKAEVFNKPLVRAYINHRWHRKGQFVLAAQLMEHITYMAIFICYAFITSRRLTDVINNSSVTGGECASDSEVGLLVTLGIMTFGYVLVEVRQAFALGWGIWAESVWSWMDVISMTLMSVTIFFHAGCKNRETGWDEDRVYDWRAMAACQILLLFLRLLYYSLAVPRVGSFVHMVLRVMKDMYLFIAMLSVVFVGFSVSFSVLQGSPMEDLTVDAWTGRPQTFNGTLVVSAGPTDSINQPISLISNDNADGRLVADGSVGAVFMTMFTLIFGGLDTDYLGQSLGPRRVGVLWACLKALYQVLVAIVLLNLLIAIINSSYGDVKLMRDAIDLRNKAILILESDVLQWPVSLEERIYRTWGIWFQDRTHKPQAADDENQLAAGRPDGVSGKDWIKWENALYKRWMVVVEQHEEKKGAKEEKDTTKAPKPTGDGKDQADGEEERQEGEGEADNGKAQEQGSKQGPTGGANMGKGKVEVLEEGKKQEGQAASATTGTAAEHTSQEEQEEVMKLLADLDKEMVKKVLQALVRMSSKERKGNGASEAGQAEGVADSASQQEGAAAAAEALGPAPGN